MVYGFPLDYMHLVLLGVMRKLLFIWARGLARSPLVFNERGRRKINRRLRKIRKYLPNEFERRSISLDHVKTWKAQEFRTFLLYTGIFFLVSYLFKYKYDFLNLGPFLLKGILTSQRYNHFLKLHMAIRILASPAYLEKNDIAHDLLVDFVEEFGVIF